MDRPSRPADYNPLRRSRLFPEDSHAYLQRPSDARTSWQTADYSQDNSWRQRWSRLSITSNWRLSRSVLESESLAVFDPLGHNSLPLQLEVSPDSEEKSAIYDDEKALSYKQTSPSPTFDRDLRTRNLCILGLISGLSIGTASLAIGVAIIISGKTPLPSFLLGKYITTNNVDYPFPLGRSKYYISMHKAYSMSKAAVYLASFMLSTCLTIIFDSMNFIQSTTLRWALWKEGRLAYNSNPRLFTGARHFAPNSKCTNAVSCIALIVGYGGVSLLTSSIYVVGLSDEDGNLSKEEYLGNRYALDFNAWGVVGLGIGLLLQGLICSWCLARSKIVPTWSSNPLSTARICAYAGPPPLEHQLSEENGPTLFSQTTSSTSGTSDRGLQAPKIFDLGWRSDNSERGWRSWTVLNSPENPETITLAVPQPRQQSMNTSVPKIQRLTYCIWLVFAIIAIWTIIVGIMGHRTGACTASYVEFLNWRLDFLAYWQGYCQVHILYAVDPWFNRRDWLGLIIQCLVLSFISLGLHSAEVLTEVTRDEAIWRKAATKGANPSAGAVMEGATSWQCWLLFAFKCVTPSIFGYAFSANLWAIMNLLPLCVLAILFLLLGMFSEFLIRHRPKGPQPTTYGSIHALLALVDDWNHRKTFWGDKGAITCTTRKAGTSGQRLADLDMKMLYAGLRR